MPYTNSHRKTCNQASSVISRNSMKLESYFLHTIVDGFLCGLLTRSIEYLKLKVNIGAKSVSCPLKKEFCCSIYF